MNLPVLEGEAAGGNDVWCTIAVDNFVLRYCWQTFVDLVNRGRCVRQFGVSTELAAATTFMVGSDLIKPNSRQPLGTGGLLAQSEIDAVFT